MDNLVYRLYKNYGDYCNWRMLPNELDGLRPVERRVLLSTYQVARDKFVKSAKINGHTLASYHPHGDVYGTIVQMVWQGFLIGQGNWGIPFQDDMKPAASRYTETKLNPDMEKMMFELLKYVPWETIDLDNEPLYLPTMFPLCLLGNIYTIGIGFGYRTLIPVYKQEDLFKRLMYLIGVRKRKPIIKPISDCEILSDIESLENLLTTGKSKIKVKGIFEVNNEDYSVSLKSWPHGRKIESLINKFKNELDQGDIGYSDFSDSNINIIFKVIKQRNRQLILDKFIEKLENEITSHIPFDIIVIDVNDNVKKISVDQLLLNSYNNYMNLSSEMLKDKKMELEDTLFEYDILEKIRPFLSQHLKKIDDYEETIKAISKDSKIEENVIRLLFSKYRINKLLTLKIDREEIIKKVKSFDDDLNNLKEYVLKKYEEN